MGMRIPLKPGSIIKMPNQGQYVICEKIGEGGLSLIYSAKTKANGYPVIIKEFFPAEHAHRAEKTLRSGDGNVIEKNISLAEKEALYILSQKKEMQLLIDIIQKRMYFINEGVIGRQGLIGLKEKIKEMCEENEQTMIMPLIDTYISELNMEDSEKKQQELKKKSDDLESIFEE